MIGALLAMAVSREDRAYPRRIAADVSVTVTQSRSGRVLLTGRVQNLSQGGMFVEADNILLDNAEIYSGTVNLDIRFPAASSTVRCRGVVVWSTDSVNDPPRTQNGGPGFGIEFVELDDPQTQLITDLLDRLSS